LRMLCVVFIYLLLAYARANTFNRKTAEIASRRLEPLNP